MSPCLHLWAPTSFPSECASAMPDAKSSTGPHVLASEQVPRQIQPDQRAFLKDPIIEWKRHRSEQKGISGKAGTSDSEKRAMKRSITIIQGRLNGVYNLRNPNHRKIHRTDGHAADQDEELTHILPLSVEGQVHKMIAEATSKENLVQTYIGWMPWL